jgi:predicted SAM-dependent methyltransferase
MELIEFNGKMYPKFQSVGFAAKFAFPYALEVCKGNGYDIGCNREEWSLPGSIPIDPVIDPTYNAMKLPNKLNVDYIFSSHCLEHLDRWVDVLDYWYDNIKFGGILFLYLPDFSQEYWRPWNNRKHYNAFTPQIIESYLKAKGYVNVFVSSIDLNNSFMAIAEK